MASHARAFTLRPAANDEDPVPMLHRTMLSLVRREGSDLTARQLAVLLNVYLLKGPHTVRGLAAELNICKPAITRALDKLGELDLARRKVDPRDRRSVLVERTDAGWRFLDDLRSGARQVAAEAEWTDLPKVEARAWPRAVASGRAGYGHGFAANAFRD
jgi:DNA-binding MarR family transcriptional regulator